MSVSTDRFLVFIFHSRIIRGTEMLMIPAGQMLVFMANCSSCAFPTPFLSIVQLPWNSNGLHELYSYSMIFQATWIRLEVSVTAPIYSCFQITIVLSYTGT